MFKEIKKWFEYELVIRKLRKKFKQCKVTDYSHTIMIVSPHLDGEKPEFVAVLEGDMASVGARFHINNVDITNYKIQNRLWKIGCCIAKRQYNESIYEMNCREKLKVKEEFKQNKAKLGQALAKNRKNSL